MLVGFLLISAGFLPCFRCRRVSTCWPGGSCRDSKIPSCSRKPCFLMGKWWSSTVFFFWVGGVCHFQTHDFVVWNPNPPMSEKSKFSQAWLWDTLGSVHTTKLDGNDQLSNFSAGKFEGTASLVWNLRCGEVGGLEYVAQKHANMEDAEGSIEKWVFHRVFSSIQRGPKHQNSLSEWVHIFLPGDVTASIRWARKGYENAK